jgi:hypothetical protein
MGLSARIRCSAILLILCLSLSGCAQGAQGTPRATSDTEPVRLQAVAGTGVYRVIIGRKAAQNLGIRTELVRQETVPVPGATTPTPARSGANTARSTQPAVITWSVIPMTAVVYDPQGSSWTYTTPAPLTFLRVPVVIDHISGGTAYLTAGPPVGTAVVTVGAPELLGTEYGVGGE